MGSPINKYNLLPKYPQTLTEPQACAIGNLVAHELGITPIVDKTRKEYVNNRAENEHWMEAIRSGETMRFSLYDYDKGIKCIEKTDFNLPEVRIIEETFEKNTMISYYDYDRYSKKEIRSDQLNGLAAVVKVMLEFDEVDAEVEEVFTKKAELIPIAV